MAMYRNNKIVKVPCNISALQLSQPAYPQYVDNCTLPGFTNRATPLLLLFICSYEEQQQQQNQPLALEETTRLLLNNNTMCGRYSIIAPQKKWTSHSDFDFFFIWIWNWLLFAIAVHLLCFSNLSYHGNDYYALGGCASSIYSWASDKMKC